MKAVAYYRVSTADKQTTGMQEQAVRDYCERENIELLKEYSDIGQSGTKESRPQFDELLKAMRNRDFDCVLVYKLDRIGRSVNHLIKLFEELGKKGVKFISVSQTFNTTTPEGKLMMRMLMILAEYERELIVSRVNSGLDKARAEGKTLGRPKGSKDKGRRRRSGYYDYWNKKRSKQSTP